MSRAGFKSTVNNVATGKRKGAGELTQPVSSFSRPRKTSCSTGTQSSRLPPLSRSQLPVCVREPYGLYSFPLQRPSSLGPVGAEQGCHLPLARSRSAAVPAQRTNSCLTVRAQEQGRFRLARRVPSRPCHSHRSLMSPSRQNYRQWGGGGAGAVEKGSNWNASSHPGYDRPQRSYSR